MTVIYLWQFFSGTKITRESGVQAGQTLDSTTPFRPNTDHYPAN